MSNSFDNPPGYSSYLDHPRLQSLFDATPSRSWRLRTRTLPLDRKPLVMGILNVTPDSFSDGGRYADTASAVDHALQLIVEGADLLDIGGESTRPYSEPVDEKTELSRVLPVIESLRSQCEIPISIDTSKARVAKEAVAAGAEIINDVSGLLRDPRMLSVAVETAAAVCVMHMQGTPQTMQDDPTYADVVGDIHEYLRQRRVELIAAGIAEDRICLDPGIGFGKTHEHNLALMANCYRFHELSSPVLVGHSRKGFLGKLIGDKQADRQYVTIGAGLALVTQRVQIIRVHDVRAMCHAISGFLSCLANI
ncbi:MAG: dihydropteroate synthase [Pirellulaceae bacterium]